MYHPGGVNNILLSQGWILEMPPAVGIVGETFQGRSRGQEPPVAPDEFSGQLGVISS